MMRNLPLLTFNLRNRCGSLVRVDLRHLCTEHCSVFRVLDFNFGTSDIEASEFGIEEFWDSDFGLRMTGFRPTIMENFERLFLAIILVVLRLQK